MGPLQVDESGDPDEAKVMRYWALDLVAGVIWHLGVVPASIDELFEAQEVVREALELFDALPLGSGPCATDSPGDVLLLASCENGHVGWAGLTPQTWRWSRVAVCAERLAMTSFGGQPALTADRIRRHVSVVGPARVALSRSLVRDDVFDVRAARVFVQRAAVGSVVPIANSSYPVFHADIAGAHGET